MSYRWSVPVLAFAALVTGYAFGGKGLQAQSSPYPFNVGDTISVYVDGATPPQPLGKPCVVVVVQGSFVRCGNVPVPAESRPIPDQPKGAQGRRPAGEFWINMNRVSGFTR